LGSAPAKEYGGAGLDFLSLAYMYEILAYAIGGPRCSASRAELGNASILVKYGTEEQKRKWLLPLIAGDMESGFSMTSPTTPGPIRVHRDRGGTRRRALGDQRTSGSPRTASTPTSSSSCAEPTILPASSARRGA